MNKTSGDTACDEEYKIIDMSKMLFNIVSEYKEDPHVSEKMKEIRMQKDAGDHGRKLLKSEVRSKSQRDESMLE